MKGRNCSHLWTRRHSGFKQNPAIYLKELWMKELQKKKCWCQNEGLLLWGCIIFSWSAGMLRNGEEGGWDKGGVKACDRVLPTTFEDISWIGHRWLFCIFSPLSMTHWCFSAWPRMFVVMFLTWVLLRQHRGTGNGLILTGCDVCQNITVLIQSSSTRPHLISTKMFRQRLTNQWLPRMHSGLLHPIGLLHWWRDLLF